MDQQSLGIVLFLLLIVGFMLAMLHQYEKAREAKDNFEKLKQSINSDCSQLNHKKINQFTPPQMPQTTIKLEHEKLACEEHKEKHLSHVYQFKHKNTVNEINKFNSRTDIDFIFIDTETTSLDTPHIIDIALIDITGSILLSTKIRYYGYISEQARTVNKIRTTDQSFYPYPKELEDDLLNILSGKTIIAYNVEFDLKALKTTFASEKMTVLIKHLDKNSICMMKVAQELFRFRKLQSLINVCKQLGVEELPAHNAKNDVLMLHSLYKKIKPLLPLAESWMLGFEDIYWKNLNLSDGTELSYWSSSDHERQALYCPRSILGSGKVAELSEHLKSDLERFGQVTFTISNMHGIPDISMHILSFKEAKENHAYDVQQWRDDYINQLVNPKMANKGKLRLKLTLDCRAANLRRTPKLSENQIYRPYVSVGDILYLPNLTYSDEFNFKDVQFTDTTGQSCGHLMNTTKRWTRVLGILMKGYRAEVHVLDVSKGLKVDVFFIKAEL